MVSVRSVQIFYPIKAQYCNNLRVALNVPWTVAFFYRRIRLMKQLKAISKNIDILVVTIKLPRFCFFSKRIELPSNRAERFSETFYFISYE